MSMRKMLIAMVLAALSGIGDAAFAQQPVKPAAQPPAAVRPLPAAPAVRRTETMVIEGWTVNCRENNGARRACSAELRVLQQEANNQQRVIFNWIVGLNDGKPVSVLQVPTGILVQPGVEVRIASKDVRKLPITLCDPVKCEAAIVMDDGFIKDVVAAAKTDVVIQAVDGRNLTFGMNTKGFDKVLAEIRR